MNTENKTVSIDVKEFGMALDFFSKVEKLQGIIDNLRKENDSLKDKLISILMQKIETEKLNAENRKHSFHIYSSFATLMAPIGNILLKKNGVPSQDTEAERKAFLQDFFSCYKASLGDANSIPSQPVPAAASNENKPGKEETPSQPMPADASNKPGKEENPSQPMPAAARACEMR